MNLLNITDTAIVMQTALTRKLTLGGITKAYPVYRVRLDQLYYNDRNDRIATWLTQYNQDPKNTPFEQLDRAAFNQVIERFIIESNPSAIEKTKNNIALVNQREPGVVLCDGRIIDGNRRFTCLRLIHQNDPEVNYFETVILDDQTGSNEKQIKMLELSIQHGEEQRVEYNLIDLTIGAYHDIVETKLLTVREYAESTNETIAEVQKRLEIAELIIDFLEYIRMPKQYHIARELQVYSLFYEAVPLLRRCEETADKENLKTCIYNNILMHSIADQRKFIRDIKKMMDEGVYAPFIRRQNKIQAKLEEAMDGAEFRTLTDIEHFARQHSDLAEDLTVAMERSVTNMKKAQSRAKPSQAIAKSISALMDIDTDVIDLLSDSERATLSKQLHKLNQTVGELNTVCAEGADDESQASETPDIPAGQKRGITLGMTDRSLPLIFCTDKPKPITNLMFTLHFSAYRYLETQQEQADFVLHFIGENDCVISDEIALTVTAGEETGVQITLYDQASAMKECRLVFRRKDQDPNEALSILPFSIQMAFSVDFGF